VIIELPPDRGAQSPLDLVAVEHIFGRLFEAFQHVSQVARTDTSAGDDAQPSKRARVPSLRRMIVPKYVMISLLFILPLILILILTTWLFVGNLRRAVYQNRLTSRRLLLLWRSLLLPLLREEPARLYCRQLMPGTPHGGLLNSRRA
jgi:hypothetical protein